MHKEQNQIITGTPISVFLHHAIPNLFGMLFMSSASLVDGYFVGNYIGLEALSAVNMTIPAISFIMGICIMMSIGGAVICGKYIGENKRQEANEYFSKTIIAIITTAVSLISLALIFMKHLIAFLGAEGNLASILITYLTICLPLVFFLCIAICLTFFVRLDDNPMLPLLAFASSGSLNIFLDWYLISQLQMGIKGAAVATGISHVVAFVILLTYFILGKSKFKFTLKLNNWCKLLKGFYNGSSEFINSISSSTVIFLLNRIMFARFGVNGVAAFTTLNYILFAQTMVAFSLSDALQPIVSTNLGARKPERILTFLNIAKISIGCVSLIVVGFMLYMPERLIGIFIKTSNLSVAKIAIDFAGVFWVTFIFNGFNIMISAYFTAMHKALPSVIIAMCRGIIFSSIFLLSFPATFGDLGIYISVPLAEALTFAIAIFLYQSLTPHKIIKQIDLKTKLA